MNGHTPERSKELARRGGLHSALAAADRRTKKWAAIGVTAEVGQKIYTQGYIAGYHQRKRHEAQKAARG